LCCQELTGECLKRIGVTILLTSLCNSFAFFLAAIIPIPAMRAFCLQVCVLAPSPVIFLSLWHSSGRKGKINTRTCVKKLKKNWQSGKHTLLLHTTKTHTHTHTQPFNGLLSVTTQVGRYQKEHSPAHTHPDQRTSFIIFLHLQRSMASSLFILLKIYSNRKRL